MAEKPQRLAMRARIARLTTISPSSIRTRDRSWVVESMRYDTAFHLPERVHCSFGCPATADGATGSPSGRYSCHSEKKGCSATALGYNSPFWEVPNVCASACRLTDWAGSLHKDENGRGAGGRNHSELLKTRSLLVFRDG